MKKLIFSFSLFCIILIVVAILDIVLSNTVFSLKKNCYNYEEYYYELEPNCSGKFRIKKSFPTIDVYTDENGLRVRKDYQFKDKDKKNILIFGDTFTFGYGLQYEDTYVGIMEKKLNEYNFYNYAVGSYSPSVHLYKLNKAIKKNILPSKIFVFLDFTDVLDEAVRWNYNYEKNLVFLSSNFNFLNSQKEVSFRKKNFRILSEISSLLNSNLRILRSKLENYLKKDSSNPVRIYTTIHSQFTYISENNLDKRFWKDQFLQKGLSKIKKNLNEMQTLAKKFSSEFYIVIYPWAETLEYGQKQFDWSEFSNDLCSIKECKLIDAIPDFTKYKTNNINWNNQLYFVGDFNFNSYGAKLLSQVVLKHLK